MAQTTFDDVNPQPVAEHDRRSSLLDHPLDLTRLSWEGFAWLALLPVALLLRTIWLHGWPLDPQEASLASAMWSLPTFGQVFVAPPADVGPVVTLLGSFWLFLFNTFDDSARLGTALVGFATVGAGWWLRPFLGRSGALVAAFLLTWSPLALYESRRLTPEPYAVFFLLVFAICLLRLYSGGGRRTLIVAAVAVTLAIFSHYLALPIALLLAVVVPLASRGARGANPPASTPGQEARPDQDTPRDRAPVVRAPTLTQPDWGAALLVGLVIVAGIALLAAGGGLTLLTTVLSPLTAWGQALAPVDRPALFIPRLLLVYEPLLLIGALASAWTVGTARETAPRRMTGLALVLWAMAALLIGALVGDRSPGQVLYPLIPLALLAGRFIGQIMVAVPWDRYRRQRGPVLSAVSALAMISLLLLINTVAAPAPGPTTVVIVKLLLDLLLLFLLLGATAYLMRPFGYRTGLRIVSLTLLGFLALYAVRSATQLAFVQPATANELAVQGQTTPAVSAVVNRIHRLSRDLTALRRTESDVTGGHGLEIAIDHTLVQPFDWYLRDFPQRTGFDPATGPTGNPQLIIISKEGAANARALLEGGYVGQEYPFLWSFPTDGIGGGARGIIRYLLYREPTLAAGTHDFSVYLRRDIADRVLFKGDPTAATGPATGLAFNLFDRNGRGRSPGQFDSPRGMAVDDQGSIWVVDTVNARLQKFDAEGIFQLSTGGAGSGPGQFGRIQNGPGPTGVTVDEQGNVYVADTWNHRIVKLDPQGKFLTAWGSFVNTQGNQETGRQHPSAFYGPRGIAIGPDNNIYVTDTGNKRVLVFDLEGRPVRQWGGLGAGPDNLNEPVGIAVDSAGVVYVADSYNGRIATFDLEGQPRAQWPVPGWGLNIYQEPYIAIAGDDVYVTSGATRSVLRFDKNGTQQSETRRADGADFANPSGIAVTPDGGILVVDTGAHAIVRLR